LRSIESSYRNLGILRLKQGDAHAASVLLDRALALSQEPGGLRPNWDVYYARGWVRLEQNRLDAAMDDLRIAARLARNWRRDAVLDDATRVSAENFIQKVDSALVEAGNRLYFATHRRALAQETFESAEANRAASLRALLAEPRAPSNADVELPDLLEHTRRSLPADAAFLAFHLGTLDLPNSYLWAVSRESFALYRLPPGREIGALVAGFTKAVREQNPETQQQGARLFSTLFGQLDAAFRRKPRWLLALDAQLFKLPFAALIAETGAQGPVFLVERHSLQIASGAGMLAVARPRRRFFDGPFVGVADPVYNMADARWSGPRPASVLGFFTANAGDSTAGDELHLVRLAGTAREVAACAAAWGGSRAPTLLEGAAASRQRLQAALASRPTVVHFATHVLDSTADSAPGARSGRIVLSLTHSGQHEVISPVEIATWNLDGALVALSGCSSGSADTLPATGLMGLTRACQAAGASAVVASHWPTPDDAGTLFLSFYRYLRAAPQTGPAVALQHAQVDMLRSRTWRSNPLYWGAYFVTGNEP
jgi:CHAT domain-containing protein